MCLRAILAVLAVAASAATASAQEAASPAEAAVFIRVIGVMRAEFQRGWKQTREARDVELGTGSGFVISPSGYVLTNSHVVSGKTVTVERDGEPVSVDLEVSRIEVVFPATATRLEAHVEAVDADLDIAVLSISGNDLPFLDLGDSDALEPGEAVQVIGFPYGRAVEVGQEVTEETIPRPTITRGSVAALREGSEGDPRYIQTDANVHPGNSGGPMLDAEGYAIGVIKMRLETRPSGPGRAVVAGPAFAIPINKVKDFLERSSLERLFPARRLHLGPEQSLDWKRVRFRLPEGFDDASPSRLRVQWAASPETALLIERVASPLGLSEIEQALRGGRELPSFGAIAGEDGRLRALGGRPALTGRGQATGPTGSPLDARYAIVDLGKEKIIAAYVGPPAQVAFNRAVLEGWLRSVGADPLLTRELGAGTPPLEPAALPHPSAPVLPMPQGWYREPLESSTCPQWAAPEAALLASPEGDFTVVLRGAWWRQTGATATQAATACTGRVRSEESASYTLERTRLGVTYAVEGLFLRVGEGLLQLEASAPKAKAAHMHELFEAWARAAGAL
jgi:S1-C subfamily serine protease